jgi:hypothetical protein
MFELAGLFKLGSGLIGLADKAIEDKDKRLEFQMRVMELVFGFVEKLLTTPTNPRVDAAVKILFALWMVGKGLFRPLGSLFALGVVVYCRMHSIELDPLLEGALAALFPGWMLSRDQEKKRKAEKKGFMADKFDPEDLGI